MLNSKSQKETAPPFGNAVPIITYTGSIPQGWAPRLQAFVIYPYR